LSDTDTPKPSVPFWERGGIILANASGFSDDALGSFYALLKKGWRIEPYLGIKASDSGVVAHMALAHDGTPDIKLLDPFLEKPVEPEPEKPGEFDGVEGWMKVEHENVNQWLSQGYTVYKAYEKNVLMMKKVVKK